MTALSKFVPSTPPSTDVRHYIRADFGRVSLSIDGIIFILAALDVPVQIGAPNSGGAGFRALIIPN